MTQDTVQESEKTQGNIICKRAKRSALSQQAPTRLQDTNMAVWQRQTHMSRDTRFPTMWYVRPAKPQISLRIRAV